MANGRHDAVGLLERNGAVCSRHLQNGCVSLTGISLPAYNSRPPSVAVPRGSRWHAITMASKRAHDLSADAAFSPKAITQEAAPPHLDQAQPSISDRPGFLLAVSWPVVTGDG
jgi:undecaprenyl pyrophosphate synthase